MSDLRHLPFAPLRRGFALAALVALLAAASGPSVAAGKPYAIDGNHSHAGFTIRHLVSKVSGRFATMSGTVHYDAQAPAASTVEVVVQADSIDTGNERRDTHLRSADFFDVAKYPTLSFKSTSVKAKSPTQLEVTGDFTMHGVTKRITVPVEVLGTMPFRGGEKAGFETTFTLDRKDYGITWNNAVDQGGMLLGDEVTIKIQLETGWAPPQPAEPAKSGR